MFSGNITNIDLFCNKRVPKAINKMTCNEIMQARRNEKNSGGLPRMNHHG